MRSPDRRIRTHRFTPQLCVNIEVKVRQLERSLSNAEKNDPTLLSLHRGNICGIATEAFSIHMHVFHIHIHVSSVCVFSLK